MNRSAFSLVSLTLLLGCTESVTGNGVAGSTLRTVDNFSSVHVNGPINVSLSAGAPESATLTLEISGDENLLPFLQTRVEKGILIVEAEARTLLEPALPLVVSGSVSSLLVINTDQGGRMTLANVNADSLQVSATSISAVALAGFVARLEINSHDSATVAADELVADAAIILADQQSLVEACAESVLEADLRDQASLVYSCSPAEVRVSYTAGTSLTSL